MGPARIYPWRKMRRSRAPSIAPGTFFVAQSWADCITNMAGFNLRQAQPPPTSMYGSRSSRKMWTDMAQKAAKSKRIDGRRAMLIYMRTNTIERVKAAAKAADQDAYVFIEKVVEE